MFGVTAVSLRGEGQVVWCDGQSVLYCIVLCCIDAPVGVSHELRGFPAGIHSEAPATVIDRRKQSANGNYGKSTFSIFTVESKFSLPA